MTTALRQNPLAKDVRTGISSASSVTDVLTEVPSDTYRLVLKGQYLPLECDRTAVLFGQGPGNARLARPADLSGGPNASPTSNEMVRDILSDHESLSRRMRARRNLKGRRGSGNGRSCGRTGGLLRDGRRDALCNGGVETRGCAGPGPIRPGFGRGFCFDEFLRATISTTRNVRPNLNRRLESDYPRSSHGA